MEQPTTTSTTTTTLSEKSEKSATSQHDATAISKSSPKTPNTPAEGQITTGSKSQGSSGNNYLTKVLNFTKSSKFY